MVERNVDPGRPQRVVTGFNPQTRRGQTYRYDLPQRIPTNPVEQRKFAESILNAPAIQRPIDARRMPGLQTRPQIPTDLTARGIPTNYGRLSSPQEIRALNDRAKQIASRGQFPNYSASGGQQVFPNVDRYGSVGGGAGRTGSSGGSSGGNPRIPPGGNKVPGSSGNIQGLPLRGMPTLNIPIGGNRNIPLPANVAKSLGRGIKFGGDILNAYNGYQALQADATTGNNKNMARWIADNLSGSLSQLNPTLFPGVRIPFRRSPFEDLISAPFEWITGQFPSLGRNLFGGDPTQAVPKGGGLPPGNTLSDPIGTPTEFFDLFRVIDGTASNIGTVPGGFRVQTRSINSGGYPGTEIFFVLRDGGTAYVGVDLPGFQKASARASKVGGVGDTPPIYAPFDPTPTVEPVTPDLLLQRPSRQNDPFFPDLKAFPTGALAPGTVPAGANKPAQKALPGTPVAPSPDGTVSPTAAPTAAPAVTPRPANPQRDQATPGRSPIPPRAPNPSEPSPSTPTATPTGSPTDNPGITSQPGPGQQQIISPIPTPTKDPKQEFQIPFVPIPPIPARVPDFKPTTEGNPTGGNPPIQPPNNTDPPCKGNSCGQAQMQKLDQQGNKLDQLQAGLQGIDLALLQAMNSKLDTINSKLGQQLPGGIAGKLTRLGQWLHLDRVLNVLTFTTTLHNAYMLSNGLSQTLFSMFSNVLAAIGIKDDEGSPLDVGSIIGKTVEAMAKEVLGVETVDGIKAAWKKFSRIYQAAANIIFSVQSIGFSIISILEILGSMTGKIGNALRGAGAVFERAYGWFNPQPNFQNRFFTALQRTEDFVSNIDAVASETLSIQETINQFGKQKEDLDKAINQGDAKVSTTAVNAEASKLNQSAADKKAEQSGFPVINVNDLIKPSEP